MHCLICDNIIDTGRELAVPTSSGGHVHMACGDAEARAASRTRALWAAASGGVLVGLAVLAADAGMGGAALLLLVVAFVAGHVLANRRWWRRAVQPIRLRLRRRF